ncbi:DsbA family protein [Streptomyces antimycoticus]|uniref:DsbA family oxidoreductase n=1 Tax=Streptomyces antimycoticus TaxID=68175 RepID=UPI00344231CF
MHGIPASRGEQILAPIEDAAHAEGLKPHRVLERTLGPTDYAHELLALATDKGSGTAVWTAMFRAHFGRARNLWTRGQAIDFAAEVGLDREEAAQLLPERRYQARVAADQREAERLGVHDRRRGVRHTWRHRHRRTADRDEQGRGRRPTPRPGRSR